MLVRELLSEVDEARIIARAILEDDNSRSETDAWITKYYALLTKLKGTKVNKSDMMLLLTVDRDEERMYGNVSGIKFGDIKAGNTIFYALEFSNYKSYASLYVPEYTVQKFGKEVVAAEALREYGFRDYDDTIKCPENVRKKVFEELKTMKSGIFPINWDAYLAKCKEEFRLYYKGKD